MIPIMSLMCSRQCSIIISSTELSSNGNFFSKSTILSGFISGEMSQFIYPGSFLYPQPK